MAEIGDRVRLASTKVGQAPREGQVIGSTGGLLQIRWTTGEESRIVPGPGSLVVLGKARARKTAGSKTPAKAAAGAGKAAKALKGGAGKATAAAKAKKSAGGAAKVAKATKPAKASKAGKAGKATKTGKTAKSSKAAKKRR